MKKLFSILLTAAILAAMCCVPAFAEIDGRLEALQGSYIELFPEFAKDEFHDYWLECISEYVDDPEMAEMYYLMLVGSCMGELKGQEAIDTYTADPDSILFNCFFTDGIVLITVEGDVISGFDENGNTVFSHTYSYMEDIPMNVVGMKFEGMDFHIYKADAEDDAFTYFAFADDTPAETYHLEFRYGPTLENIGAYYEGEYAYWLAAAISSDYAEGTMMQDCIKLFVDENMAELAGEEAPEVVFAGGTGTAEDPWQIATAEQLDLMHADLTAHYVLIDDIDLSGYENWDPIGAFQSLSDKPEEAEIPHPDFAFTGTFDGNGYTISNLTIDAPMSMGVGLFGCTTGTENGNAYVGNFALENVNVTGFYLVGGAVGLQFMNSPVSNISLIGKNCLSGMQGIGGIVGTGFDLISDCTATADIIAIGDDGACAGLIAGGTTMSSIINCEAIGGSITSEGNASWGFGAISGAPWGAAELTGCKASDTVITVSGEGNRLVGGLFGFAGSYDPSAPAQINGCEAENVTIIVSGTTNEVGGLVGAGKEMMEGSDVMSIFEISDCSVSGTIIGGGEFVDVVVGDPSSAVSIECDGGMVRR